MDKKNNIIGMIAVIIVVAGGSFYGGMQYGANKSPQSQLAQGGGKNGGNFGAGMNGGQRGAGQGGGQAGQGGGQRGSGAAGNMGDFISGQVIAKDDTSVTIKGRDGSSKIVFLSSTTSIDKSVSGGAADLAVGQQVNANGKTNADGSLAAQNIQIRPTQPAQPVQ